MRGALPPLPKSLCLHVVVGLTLYYLLIYRFFMVTGKDVPGLKLMTIRQK